jgi:hypothetical protein
VRAIRFELNRIEIGEAGYLKTWLSLASLTNRA